eukprot:14909008-Alexandrium_andersonii.AAC.1
MSASLVGSEMCIRDRSCGCAAVWPMPLHTHRFVAHPGSEPDLYSDALIPASASRQLLAAHSDLHIAC